MVSTLREREEWGMTYVFTMISAHWSCLYADEVDDEGGLD